MRALALFLCLALPFIISRPGMADECHDEAYCMHPASYHGAGFGPISYYLKRQRDGGSRQEGGLYGFHVFYERIKPKAFYWGVDYFRSTGELNGRTGSGSALTSDYTEWESEIRAGYTWQLCWPCDILVSPFAGGGYFQSDHQFRSPSPMLVEFRNTYSYGSAGITTRAVFAPGWTLGFRGRAMYNFQPRNQVTGDPVMGTITTLIENEMQYHAELPVHYTCFSDESCFELIIAPFYYYRHLGGRENFPFDFVDTRFHLYGLRLQLLYNF